MNKADFYLNFIESHTKSDFSFVTPDAAFQEPKKLSSAQQTVIKIVQGAALSILQGSALGMFGGLATGYFGKTSKDELIADLKMMNQYCDLVGVHLASGLVWLRLAIDADELAYEILVDRFALIHQRTHDFRKYSLSLFSNKMPTRAEVIVAFSSQQRAKEFSDKFAKRCKHWAYWKQVMTYPWVADLEDEKVTGFQLDLGHVLEKRLNSCLFQERLKSNEV